MVHGVPFLASSFLFCGDPFYPGLLLLMLLDQLTFPWSAQAWMSQRKDSGINQSWAASLATSWSRRDVARE